VKHPRRRLFAHHHTDDVYVDWKVKNRLRESSTSRRRRRTSIPPVPRRPRSSPTRSGSAPGNGPASPESWGILTSGTPPFVAVVP